MDVRQNITARRLKKEHCTVQREPTAPPYDCKKEDMVSSTHCPLAHLHLTLSPEGSMAATLALTGDLVLESTVGSVYWVVLGPRTSGGLFSGDRW